jgi:cytochrome oxidase Cu insertion factor (SCO1/SenC/PrrC family)
MDARRTAIPVLMIVAAALILGAYSLLGQNRAAPTPTLSATPARSASATNRPIPPSTSPPTQESGGSIPETGSAAPDFSLNSAWGEMVALSTYRGHKNVVVLFYRTGG